MNEIPSTVTIITLTIAASAVLALAQSSTPQPSTGKLMPGREAQQPYQEPMPPGPSPNSQYRLGPDSMPQEGVPKGEIRGPYELPSNIYPGTSHTYWIYVPTQHDPAIPVALMVYQDGKGFKSEDGDLRAQNVMDNLIYRREIPVTIGVFINPGRTPEQAAANPQDWGDRTTNRPIEYNSLDDKYARVITEELMPLLYKEYNISKDRGGQGLKRVVIDCIQSLLSGWNFGRFDSLVVFGVRLR